MSATATLEEAVEAARAEEARTFRAVESLKRTDARHRDAFTAWDHAWSRRMAAERELQAAS